MILSTRERKKSKNFNKYHLKINLTIKVNPSKFLDTKIINNKGIIVTEAYCKTSKLTVDWSFSVPKRYKQNAGIGDLLRSKRVSSNFKMEIKVIKRKFKNVYYPPKI